MRSSLTEKDMYFMRLAESEATKSDDPRAKESTKSAVGAVIAIRGALISRSANVLPQLLRDSLVARGETLTERTRLHLIEHAERAAIYAAHASGTTGLAGATMYCTRFPCSDCARAIIWTGMRRLVVPTGFSGETDWIQAQRMSLKMLRLAGVTIRYLGRVAAAGDLRLPD